MSSHPVTPPATTGTARTPSRADGIEARQRLIDAGLRLFAQNGFQQTSVREVAQAAQVNLASISYYFGDKTGLYRAVFTEPLGQHSQPCRPVPENTGKPLAELLPAFFADFMQPLKFGEQMQLSIKLHYREMIEPTGILQHTIDNEMRPVHDGLVRALVQELGLRRSDVDVQRLAVCIIGMAVHFFACQPIVNAFAPQLLDSERSIDALAQRLALFAVAMIDAERGRRKRASS